MRDSYEKHAAAWLPQAESVLVRILEFLGAARLISRRYFAGEDILFPDTRENLKLGLEAIANLRESYDDTICGTPQTDDEFRDYLLAMVDPERDPRARQGLLPPARTCPTCRRERRSWPSSGSSWPARRPLRSSENTRRRKLSPRS